MGPATVRLLDLQELDSSIDRRRARIASLEAGRELAAARETADAAEARQGELGLQLDELNRDASRLEHEIDSIDRKTADEDKRLYDGSIVNVKELEALQHEIVNLRGRKSDREDELLALMERREAVEAEADVARREAEAQRASAEATAESGRTELAELEEEVERASKERGDVAAEIEPELLELYEDLRRQKKGIGAAALEDGVCQGCHEQLSAVELDRLKHAEGVKRCEHCRRILVT